MGTARKGAGRPLAGDRGTAKQSNVRKHFTALLALAARLVGLHALAAWIEARRSR